MGITKFTPKTVPGTGSGTPSGSPALSAGAFSSLQTPPDSPIFGSAPRSQFTREPPRPISPPYPVNDHDLFASINHTIPTYLSTPPDSPPSVGNERENRACPTSASSRFPHLIPNATMDLMTVVEAAQTVQQKHVVVVSSQDMANPEMETDPRKIRQKYRKGKKQDPASDKESPKQRSSAKSKAKKKSRRDQSTLSDDHNIEHLKARGVNEDSHEEIPRANSEHLKRRDAGILGEPTRAIDSGSTRETEPTRPKHPRQKKRASSPLQASRSDQRDQGDRRDQLSTSRAPGTQEPATRPGPTPSSSRRRNRATSSPNENTPNTRRRDRARTRPRRASLDTIPSIPPPLDEYHDETPPYRERLHKSCDLLSFDPRYNVPVLRVNRALIKNDKLLESSISKMTRYNILPSEIDLWGLNHVDDSQFHSIIPMLLFEHDQRAQHGLSEEDQLHIALQISALETDIQPENHGFRYNGRNVSTPGEPGEVTLNPTPESQIQTPLQEQPASSPDPSQEAVRHSPPHQTSESNTYSAQLFRSLNNNPLFSGFRYNPIVGDTHSLYSQNSLTQVEPV
ncbi:uncharacterized protein CANTADRAFT_173874 [Suhomyces tanzawaensis NRRL Y-17324]|uniref:Uncharacterized protein n=1 Tax=Suhomyces tanzawaensis NRRL Y-17324 TaxID=984487 RepID=A0A1E4SN26_9ASCO|nr:uncharacterized protein CANTADRAFT_173874 [Suhomyces tanzawaensis NRRL Y-17324]ODV80888.1 hypothetical protein CANTADRAFT_173874 [Suhomyces tanzawaensis NRRL Y-17324]